MHSCRHSPLFPALTVASPSVAARSQLVETEWSAAALAQFTPHISDLQLSPAQNKALVLHVCKLLSAVELTNELPIIVLALCSIKRVDKCAMLGAVLQLFHELDARHGVDEGTAASKKKRSTRALLLQLEQTTLLCLQASLTQEPFLGEVLLHLVSSRQAELTPFCLSLLLAMAHLRRHHDAALDFLHAHLLEHLTSFAHHFDSYTLRDVIDAHRGVFTIVGPLVMATVANSKQLDLIQPYLVELGMRMLDTRCTPDKGALSRLSKVTFETFQITVNLTTFTPQVNAVFIGASIVHEVFLLAPIAQQSILEQLCDRIIRNVNALPSILLLRRLVDSNPAGFFAHKQRILDCIDHLINLPPNTALLFIRAILRLLHAPSVGGEMDDSVRSRLLMVLKKLLFSSAYDARLLACDGVLCLIEAVLKGQMAGAAGDESVGSLSQSSSQSSGPTIDLPLLMELLALLRRVLSSSAAIKQVLYARLTSLYGAYPIARKHILDLLMPAFRFCQTDAPAGRVPFHLQQCVYGGVISEPLAHLMQTLVVALCFPAHSALVDEATHGNLRVTLKGCIERMATLSNKDIGFRRADVITADTDVSRCVLMHGLYQACMEYALCVDQRGLIDEAKDAGRESREQVTDENWLTFKELFARFIGLDDWLSGRKEKDEGGSSKSPKKKQRTASKSGKDDGSGSSDDSDDGGLSGKRGGRSQKAGERGARKGKGGAKGKGRGKGKEERATKKKKVAVELLLSPLALNLLLRRLLLQEYRAYVSAQCTRAPGVEVAQLLTPCCYLSRCVCARAAHAGAAEGLGAAALHPAGCRLSAGAHQGGVGGVAVGGRLRPRPQRPPSLRPLRRWLLPAAVRGRQQARAGVERR